MVWLAATVPVVRNMLIDDTINNIAILCFLLFRLFITYYKLYWLEFHHSNYVHPSALSKILKFSCFTGNSTFSNNGFIGKSGIPKDLTVSLIFLIGRANAPNFLHEKEILNEEKDCICGKQPVSKCCTRSSLMHLACIGVAHPWPFKQQANSSCGLNSWQLNSWTANNLRLEGEQLQCRQNRSNLI